MGGLEPDPPGPCVGTKARLLIGGLDVGEAMDAAGWSKADCPKRRAGLRQAHGRRAQERLWEGRQTTRCSLAAEGDLHPLLLGGR